MTVAVRIEGEAFSDLRYSVLAKLCQLADDDHARGKMARLWAHCTARASHTLPREVVAAVLGDSGPESLVSAGLGEPSDDGIRIRGTRGRIEWLAKLRKNARKGGRAKAAKRQNIGSPEGDPGACQTPASAHPEPFPLSPSLSPSLSQRSQKEEISPRKPKRPRTPLPESWSPSAALAAVAREEGRDCEREAKRFRDHALSSGRLAADWDAAFRNWLRSEHGRGSLAKPAESPRCLEVIA